MSKKAKTKLKNEPVQDDQSEVTDSTQSQSDQSDEKITALEEMLDQLKDEAQLAKSDALRHLAELENFKRRKQQEVDTFKKYASERVVLEILPVLDTFELACCIPEEQRDNKSLTQFISGFELILKQFQQVLSKLDIIPIDPEGEIFDPNFHQAVAQESREGTDSNIVLKVMQKGYQLHDRVIRPAMVVVSS